MSDTQSRPAVARGRGSSYRGRGGYSSRGGRGGSRIPKSEEQENLPPAAEDQGETGLLKKKYGSKVASLKEIFPDWTDDDLVFALDETNGELEGAINGITEGAFTQAIWPFSTRSFLNHLQETLLNGVKSKRSIPIEPGLKSKIQILQQQTGLPLRPGEDVGEAASKAVAVVAVIVDAAVAVEELEHIRTARVP